MAEKSLKTRIVHKHDVEANWLLATGFTPKQGEIIIYDVDENYAHERMKIGDGVRNVNDLPFSPEIATVDWNQTDETAVDYIKNKTHGELIGWNPIVENTKITGGVEETDLDGNFIGYYCSDFFGARGSWVLLTQEVLYKVVINEKEKESYPKTYSYTDDYGNVKEYVYLGNPSLSLTFIGKCESTDDDFLIVTRYDYSNDIQETQMYYKEQPDNLTVSLYEQGPRIKQIDHKYIPKADWNQNENDGEGYIKNRTHYDNMTTITNTYPNNLLEAIPYGSNKRFYKISDEVIDIADDFYGFITVRHESDVILTVNGETDLHNDSPQMGLKIAKLDDSGTEFWAYWEVGMYHVSGKAIIITAESYEYDTHNESPCVLSKGVWVDNDIIKSISTLDSVKQLDERFIPDTIARKTDITWDNLPYDLATKDFTEEIIVDSLTYEDYNNGYKPACNFIPNETYKVIWNGEVYDNLVCSKSGDYNVIMPNEEDFPGYIDDDGGDNLYINPANYRDEWVVTIIQKKVVYVFDEECIPDTIARKTDLVGITWDNILDKPYGGFGWEEDNRIIIEWDGNIEEKENLDGFVYKVSDLTPSVEDVIGATVQVNIGEVLVIEESIIDAPLDGLITIGQAIAIINLSDEARVEAEAAGMQLPSNGTYFMSQGGMFISSLSYGDIVIHQIDEKFIPDTIARKSDISLPTSAQVGQTIVVKSVDENGKPTEWEAVDPWVMTSTTEGSTKKFKLSIGDDGVLTATEIEAVV